ncbi:MAG: hypothetical protein HKP58_09075, partial [Desulfatitalea sp.]|nr:hypothetical protein [Desulfatitalea sp.]NNK00552.1 hypothetical protein [Desulfatitalea sp.]
MAQNTRKTQLALFGRMFALLLNRSMMYQSNHPFIKQSVDDVLKVATPLLEEISPLVFILNRDQFYIDEEQLDSRLNVTRSIALFKSNDLQSISFEQGLTDSELIGFADTFASLTKSTNADMLKKSLTQKGVFNIRINHVVFKKVTQDDQVISRDALKQITPVLGSDDQETRKRFMDSLLESVLTDEFAQTLNITNLVSNPAAFTQRMIEADMAGTLPLEEAQNQIDGDVPAAIQDPTQKAPPAASGGRGAGAPSATGDQIWTDTGTLVDEKMLKEENLNAKAWPEQRGGSGTGSGTGGGLGHGPGSRSRAGAGSGADLG